MDTHTKKINILLVCGGKSGEHEVSLLSANSVYQALDKARYNITLVGIDKQGIWRTGDPDTMFLNASDPKNITLATESNDLKELTPKPGEPLPGSIDVVLPILHGTYGEDGAMQGFLELLDVAYVGSGVLGSAVGMDKDVMKRLLMQAGIPVCKYINVREHKLSKHTIKELEETLDYPMFVKPANLGSSVGVSKAKNVEELQDAVQQAFHYDTKVVIEEFIPCRELEVAVLGTNTHPEASIVGEVKPSHEFYSYESKYLDEKGAETIIPADIPEDVSNEVRRQAIEAFKVLECYGMSRVDFFYSDSGKVYLNEINTIPGFTSISMYPKLWEASGLPYSQLLDRLIDLALQRQDTKAKLLREFE